MNDEKSLPYVSTASMIRTLFPALTHDLDWHHSKELVRVWVSANDDV